MRDFATTLLTITIWTYWLCVVFMIVRIRRRTHRLAGVVPEQRAERLMWLIWVPLVGCWLVLPYLAGTQAHGALAVPEFARDDPVFANIRWAAAVCAVACLALTIECWSRMGKNWRMAVTPGEEPQLVTDGLYAYIRHPIYALSILLMSCSVLVVPTIPMVVVATVHILLMIAKARNEERFLLDKLGVRYAAYRERTGAFFPPLRARHS
ncbi:MAG TPA: isoprenylcysteine carboxylmethyltransferase family protein [Burkholderiales bacterium]|nr:isoprenylcysteine carboxylmethyltransferase family protein [Burkholderiales bacterium]